MELLDEPKSAGWSAGRISEGSQELNFQVSHFSDTLGDMAKAAAMLLNGSREESFSFPDEPGEHRFVLTRGVADSLTIRVLWFGSVSGRTDRFGKEVFRCDCAVLDLVGQVFANLHTILGQYGLDGYQQAFRNFDCCTPPGQSRCTTRRRSRRRRFWNRCPRVPRSRTWNLLQPMAAITPRLRSRVRSATEAWSSAPTVR